MPQPMSLGEIRPYCTILYDVVDNWVLSVYVWGGGSQYSAGERNQIENILLEDQESHRVMRNGQTVLEKLRVETKIASVWIATAWLVRRFKRNWDQNRKWMNFQQPDWSKGTRKTNHIRHLAKEDQNEWITHKQKEKKNIF